MRNRDRRRPLDGWDPYGDDPAPRWSRWNSRRLFRLSLPAIVALLAFSHDLVRLFEHDAPTQSASMEAVYRPPVVRPVPPDSRTQLPRPAKPVESPADWITSDDYPVSAERENLAGVVKFRFGIGPDGKVRDCVPIATSGSPLLDETTCCIFAQHARYWPAGDKTGRTIAATQTQTVRWQIPKD